MTRREMEVLSIGIFAGAVAGFVMGLLFAPSSGASTRRRIAEEAQKAADIAREIAERAERTAGVLAHQVDHYLGRDEEVAWRKVEELREGLRGYTQTQA